ncbi:MAG: hypothetical protein NWR51_12645 [Akkermansiaceae bacterium]|nr:hypothetical protein [Akkermansiaceae bacterium]MDP4781463.1 hypothetical protein [Akkermansiaceae bacterium]MDP4848096.1 hypothetical protein [Akkermansiaceae bacterium]
MAAESEKIELHVAAEADSLPDGTVEKPYGSLALESLRALRKSGNVMPAVIYLRGGRHVLKETLVLGLEDGSQAGGGAATFEKYGAGESVDPPHLTIAATPGGWLESGAQCHHIAP